MSHVKTLPLLDGTKVIVVDEDIETEYAQALIAGWIPAWKEKSPDYSIDLLSFVHPPMFYNFEPLTPTKVTIHDYFSVHPTENVEKKDSENLRHILKNFKIKPHNTVIVDSLGTLVAYKGLKKAIRFIEKLSKQVSQLICIYQRDFVKVPAIQTFGTTYVKVEKFKGKNSSTDHIMYIAKLTHRKSGGSVICQTETIKQDIESYQITVEEITVPSVCKTETEPVKVETSFKIEMSAQEMEQRDKTPLPYTLNAPNTSKIFYQPEDEDDIDEEDPDDDLCI